MSGIVESAVEELLISEVHGVIGLLVSRIGAEIKLAWGLQKQLKELEGQFTTLSKLLQGASCMRITNPLMAHWLKKIKDVAEDVDNLLDEWSYKALEHRTQTTCWDMFMHIISQPFYSLAMAHKVKHVRKLIRSIDNDATKLGINLVHVAGGEVYGGINSREIEKQDNDRLNDLRERVDLQLFRGRNDDLEELVKLLCDPNNTNSHLTVIGIVGLAGLGKTTLSKHISMAPKVTNFFNNVVIWLVVSHNYDLENLLKQMVDKVSGSASGMGRRGLIDELRKKMEGKKFLIILDDVWDTLGIIRWDSLQSTLHEIGVSKGTTLLVTSRDKKVVETLYTTKETTIYQLKGLSPDDSWSLFLAKFNDKIVGGSEEEQIAERLVDKCGGVPLAIRVLADLLRGKRIEKWREIEKSEIWTKEDEYGILPSLRLSYNYLPHIALKKCFAFCAIFEEDAVIYKHNLIYMWMAQGFLQPNDKMEPKGEEYIEHLLNSSLFQDARFDRYGNVYAFKMHDLVWSLAGVVSKGECLCLYRDEDLEKVRHLLVSNKSVSRELTSTSFKKLQTCMLSKEIENPSLHIWLKCKQLRVLVIGRNWSENTDWKPLARLIHLRHFEITAEDFAHFNLPDQITKLYHLQTLIIDIPHFIDMSLYEDPSKNPFPKGLGNLVNLRHILTQWSMRIGVPMGLSNLSGLQTLPIINLGWNWGGRISDMGLLANLRGKLEIHCLELLTTVEEGRSLDLCRKSNLDSLVLNWGDGYERADKKNPKANEIVEALQPHQNLHKLQLRFFDGTAFPKWLMGPDSPLNKIVSLTIWFCEEAEGDLKLENFIYLRILRVAGCNNLTVTFPHNRSQCCKHLEELKIIDCEKVEELPDLFLMPKLQVIEIRGNNSTSRDVLVGLGSLSHLKKLKTDLKLPVDLGENSPVCKSLEKLRLDGSKYYNGDTTTDLPDQFQHLVALRSLTIEEFKSVEAIPNWLGKLTSLNKLHLYKMPKLKQLPPQDVMQSLSNLSSLSCYVCPILEEDFENESGEWFKIAHIGYTYPDWL